jgi:hypothetical protein
VIDLGLASAVASQAAGYGIADALAGGGEPTVVLADPIEPFLSVGEGSASSADGWAAGRFISTATS